MPLPVSVTFAADKAQIAEARALLTPRQFTDGMRRAKNRTAQSLKTRISTRLREIINIRKKDLDPLIILKKASNDRDATITVTRKPMSLRFYKPQQTAAGVKVKIWQGSPAELLRSTFKITSGDSPVYERQRVSGSGGTAKRVKRFPLAQRFGPTGVGVLAGRPGLLDSVVAEGDALLGKNIDSQVDFILNRSKFSGD